jgi:transcriptional regulator with XRE-family HTH domain
MVANVSSITEIARATGLSKSHISRVLQARRCPSLDVASRIAGYLNMSLDEFAALFAEQQNRRDHRVRTAA